MKKKLVLNAIILSLFIISCTVTFITGYDATIDETATKLKRDFNLFFIKLSRTLHDTDPQNQNFANFQDYYDNMEVDLKTLKDRTLFLPPKSQQVKEEISNIDILMLDFEKSHQAGFKDISATNIDDKHVESNNINSAINALIKLQEELKSTGKITSSN